MEAILWSGALLALGATALRWLGATEASASVALPMPERSRAPALAPDGAIRQAADVIVGGDPFRIDHAPPTASFRPDAHAQPVPPPAPRPTLLVDGIVGPPWSAVLEGIPGRTGAVVVHAGQRFGALRIRQVSRDTVVIVGLDTTWRLGVRRAW